MYTFEAGRFDVVGGHEQDRLTEVDVTIEEGMTDYVDREGAVFVWVRSPGAHGAEDLPFVEVDDLVLSVRYRTPGPF